MKCRLTRTFQSSGLPLLVVKTKPRSSYCDPACSRSSNCSVRCFRKVLETAGGIVTVRRPRAVFGSLSDQPDLGGRGRGLKTHPFHPPAQRVANSRCSSWAWTVSNPLSHSELPSSAAGRFGVPYRASDRQNPSQPLLRAFAPRSILASRWPMLAPPPPAAAIARPLCRDPQDEAVRRQRWSP